VREVPNLECTVRGIHTIDGGSHPLPVWYVFRALLPQLEEGWVAALADYHAILFDSIVSYQHALKELESVAGM